MLQMWRRGGMARIPYEKCVYVTDFKVEITRHETNEYNFNCVR